MKDKKCRNCEHVKILDEITGRCMREVMPPTFCKLDEKSHVCDDYKAVKK